jgi:hypothetical protein
MPHERTNFIFFTCQSKDQSAEQFVIAMFVIAYSDATGSYTKTGMQLEDCLIVQLLPAHLLVKWWNDEWLCVDCPSSMVV